MPVAVSSALSFLCRAYDAHLFFIFFRFVSYSDIHLYQPSLQSRYNFTSSIITTGRDGSGETMLLLNLARFSPEI